MNFSVSKNDSSDNYMLTETEVKDIIRGYNIQLKMLTDDNFLLQEQLNHSQIENADLNTQMIKMEKERKANLLEKEQIISELNKLKNELEKKEKEILDFLKIQNQKDSTNYGEDFQKLIEEIEFAQKDEIKTLFETIIEENLNLKINIENLKTYGKHLEDEIHSLKISLESHEKEKARIKFCIHCKNEYNPLKNENVSCKFHPGKLKFYSCRACGGDEYYNCCNTCSKCCIGCREGKHICVE